MGIKSFKKMVVLIPIVFVLLVLTGAVVNAESIVSGTLSAKLDEPSGTVTAMFVGYCQGAPVMIGPVSWQSSSQEFANAGPEEIGARLCGSGNIVSRVTRTVRTGKELVSEVLITSDKPAILVGR